MTRITDIANQIQDTTATLRGVEGALARDPTSLATLTSAKSLQKRLRALEAEFARETADIGVDVCTYRMFGDRPESHAAALARAVERFQVVLSSVYSALKSGAPRATVRVPAEDAAESALGFGYSFSGSVGFALPIMNQRPLFGESILEVAVGTLFQMARAESPEDISRFARRLGSGPVRALYLWARAHSMAGLGAELAWTRQAERLQTVIVDEPEFQHLSTTIELSSEEDTYEVTLPAMLVGFDSAKGTFHLAFDDGDDVRGVLSDSLDFEPPARVPARYTATLLKTTRTQYSLENDIVHWVLTKMVLS